MNTVNKIRTSVAVVFLAGFLFVPSAWAEQEKNNLPFAIRAVGGTDFVCAEIEGGEVECRVDAGRFGTVIVQFPPGTQAYDPTYGIELEVRNINGRMGLRIEGALLPEGQGETIIMPRMPGAAGSRLCVRDFPGANFESADSPCFDGVGQGRVDVPLGTGSVGFYLSDGKFREVEYDQRSVTVSGLRHTAIMFDHNEPPIANDDQCRGYEDGRSVCSVLANDVDLDGDLLHIIEVSPPLFGRAWVADHGIVYEPPPEWFGFDTFRYFVTDGRATAMAIVSVPVERTNDAPVAVKDTLFVHEDSELTYDVVANDYDRDSASLELAAVGRPVKGQATITDDGLLRYVPPANWYGEEKFSYTVSDGDGGETEGEVRVLVKTVNDCPVAKSSSARTSEDKSVSGRVTATDIDGDDLIFFLSSRPKNGRIDFKEDGSWTYLPNRDYFGTDSFGFFVTDGLEVSNMAEVTIEVSYVDDRLSQAQTEEEYTEQLASIFRGDYWNTCYSWMTDCNAADQPSRNDSLGLVSGIEMAREATAGSARTEGLADRLTVNGVPVKKAVVTTADLIWQLVRHYVLRPLFDGWF